MEQNRESLKKITEKANPYKIFEIKGQFPIKKQSLENTKLSSKVLIKRPASMSPEISKRLKNITLSNIQYKKYISGYEKVTKDNCFKTPSITQYPKRKNIQYLHASYIKTNDKAQKNFSIKKAKMNNFFNITNVDNNSNSKDPESFYKNISDYNINEEEKVKKMPYGFKYKDTKIILHLKNKSNLYIKNKKFMKNRKIYRNVRFDPSRNKEREIKNKNNNYFLSFSNGDFFENRNNTRNNCHINDISKINQKNKRNNFEEFKPFDIRYTKSENKEYHEKIEKNLLFLFEEIKNIINNKTISYRNNNIYNVSKKKFEYDIQSELRIIFRFIIEIKSIYLEFIEINPKDNFKIEKNQKLYFPFYYLPFFYILNFSAFKCFLSEIIIYNNNTKEFGININNENNIFNKYIKFAEIYHKNYNKIKEKINAKIFEDITYNMNENKYNIKYNWCIYNKNQKIHDNKIYKMIIHFPIIKFNFNEKKIKLRKLINKNLIIELFKKKFNNWNKYILFDLFILKKFRIIINNILSHRFDAYKNKKIHLEQNYRNNSKNENKNDFFITFVNSNTTKFFNFIPITVILSTYFNSKEKKTNFIQLSLKDTNNIKKLSKCLDISNIISKCICIKKETKEAILNMNVIENISDDFIKVVENENLAKNIDIKNNNEENDIFEYKINDIEINAMLRRPNIININYDLNQIDISYYDIPEILYNELLNNINGDHTEYIYNSLNQIVLNIKNFEENGFINYNKEIINLRNGESSVKKNFGKILRDIKVNGGNSLFYGKFNKKMKMAKNIAKLFSYRSTKLFTENNFFESKSKINFYKYSLNMKKSSFNDNFYK